jgi:hypothetical protein
MQIEQLVKQYTELFEKMKMDINAFALDYNDKDFVYNMLNKKLSKLKDYSAKFDELSENFSEFREKEEEEIFILGMKINVQSKYNQVNEIEKSVYDFSKYCRNLYSFLEETCKNISESLKVVYSELEEKINDHNLKEGLEVLDRISRFYNENN